MNGLQFFFIKSHKKIRKNNRITEKIVAIPDLLFFKKKMANTQRRIIAVKSNMLRRVNFLLFLYERCKFPTINNGSTMAAAIRRSYFNPSIKASEELPKVYPAVLKCSKKIIRSITIKIKKVNTITNVHLLKGEIFADM